MQLYKSGYFAGECEDMIDEWREGIGECKELRCEEPRSKMRSGRCPAEQVDYARYIASGIKFDRDDPSNGNALCICSCCVFVGLYLLFFN